MNMTQSLDERGVSFGPVDEWQDGPVSLSEPPSPKKSAKSFVGEPRRRSSLSSVEDFLNLTRLSSEWRAPKERRRSSSSVASTTFSEGFFSTRSFGGDSTQRSRKSSKVLRQEREVGRQFHRERRGLGQRAMTSPEFVDHVTEQIIAKTTQTPWFLEPCAQHPSCQRVCFPAEHATRNRREISREFSTGGTKLGEDEYCRFGFPDFHQAGYCLIPPQDTIWSDERVPLTLGLQMAVHRKSSTERLCYACPKTDLPTDTSKEQLAALARALKRCDHVNILRCHDVCEDEDTLYFLYEHVPCVTLLAALEHHKWTQPQMANLARECCAAVNFATAMGVSHLGWTLCHVLLPESSLAEIDADPSFAKVFGFGLQGMVHVDARDQMCWAPEALQGYDRVGDSFCSKMDMTQKSACDHWSLGVIVYSIVARRPPILGSPAMMKELIFARKWQFTLAFETVDRECKTLVEGLLASNATKRGTAEGSLRNEWFRRQCTKNHRKAPQVLVKTEEFVKLPLAKRLFGRFLVRFLDASHMRKVAQKFYALDKNGDGLLCTKDLYAAAKHADRSNAAAHEDAHALLRALAHEGQSFVTISRFAESMAEEVIDGKALRHAFESLDDDGSEFISAEELHEALSTMDPTLTLQEVMEHIEEAEKAQEEEVHMKKGKADKDRKIHFHEFAALFPVRVQWTKTLQARLDGLESKAEELGGQFDGFAQEAKAWMKGLRDALAQVHKLQKTQIDKDGPEAVREMKKHFAKIADALRCPPGPNDAEQQGDKAAAKASAKKRGKTAKRRKQFSKDDEVLGFNSFLQDQAVCQMWSILVTPELRLLKQSLMIDGPGKESVDHFKAHDAATSLLNKVSEVLAWAKDQFEEYEAIVDTLRSSMDSIPTPHYSARGLRSHGEDCETTMENEDAYQDSVSMNPVTRILSRYCSRPVSKAGSD